MIFNTSEIIRDVQYNGYKLLTELNWSKKDLSTFMLSIGSCETPGLFMNDAEHPEIFHVTGKKDENGNKLGMFGSGELGWHSNGNSRHLIDKILIALYCVQGEPNTTLSVCNTSLPFYDMSDDEQEYWKTIKVRLKFQNDTIYHLDDNDPELEFMSANRGSIRSLVSAHPITGKYYFYFPYHFITKVWEGKKQVDPETIIEPLKKKIFKSRYQFHHILQEGDLLLMDQLITLHRRTPVLGDRLLWRVASDYSVIQPA